MLGELKRDVGDLTRRVDELRGIFDLPAKEQRLAQLDIELAAPAFWDDNRRAQELIRERTEQAGRSTASASSPPRPPISASFSSRPRRPATTAPSMPRSARGSTACGASSTSSS